MAVRDGDGGAGGGTGPDDDGPGRGPDDVDELDDDGDDDGGDEDKDGDDGEGEYVAPTREAWERLQRIAAARKRERNEARAALRQARDQGQAGAGSGAGKDDAGDPAAGQHQVDAEGERWKAAAVRSSAAVALTAAGFTGTAKQAKRLTRLIDLADVEPDPDGDFDLEDEIEDLKAEFPQLFRREEPAGRGQQQQRRPTTADRGRDTPRDATDDPTARTSDRLLRSAGVPARSRRRT